MSRKLAAALGAAVLLTMSAGVSAQQAGTVTGDRAGDMTADLLLVRPLGLVGTVIGAAVFVVALPFTLPTGSAGDAAHELVGKPFEYTFNRPLGDFHYCGADRHPCGDRRDP
ncbi:hypothetical protein LLG90_09000 [Aromatoleum toluclasticum]|uniref:hypothetical protein n=1 Tax=Aromatoleum toluclasticum TaxID=92003 RepID=UPI00037705FB|nr:hypothetical protein [Aromatoleum toluclasticum]MCC4115485.1 hypothetical protein [Aromatoleum toluclasticum]